MDGDTLLIGVGFLTGYNGCHNGFSPFTRNQSHSAVILGVPQGVAYEIGRFRPLLLILYDKISSKSNLDAA